MTLRTSVPLQVRAMLAKYTQGRDAQAFIEGITQLLKAPATVHLLQVRRGGQESRREVR